eukprot:c21518_g1_i2 orf=134-649(-)
MLLCESLFPVFDYVAGSHDVVQVDKSGYDSCSDTTTYFDDNGKGNTTIKLNSTGSHYYICTVPQHCSPYGMKLAINVVAAATTPSSAPSSSKSPSPASSPSSGEAPSPTTSTPSPGSSTAPSPSTTTSPVPPSPPSAEGPSGGSNSGSNLVKPTSTAVVLMLVTALSVFLH